MEEERDSRVTFIGGSPSDCIVDEKLVELSMIFKWFQSDFKASAYHSVIGFVNQYLEVIGLSEGIVV